MTNCWRLFYISPLSQRRIRIKLYRYICGIFNWEPMRNSHRRTIFVFFLWCSFFGVVHSAVMSSWLLSLVVYHWLKWFLYSLKALKAFSFSQNLIITKKTLHSFFKFNSLTFTKLFKNPTKGSYKLG